MLLSHTSRNPLTLVMGGCQLSRYIIEKKSEYYARLLGVTEKEDWQSWILFMLETIAETAQWTRKKVLAIHELQEETIRKIKETPELHKIYSRELVNCIFAMPYVRINTLVEKNLGTRQTVSKYLRALVKTEILNEINTSKTHLFVNAKLLAVLTP